MVPEKAALKDNLQQKQVNLTFSADLVRTVAIFLIILVHAGYFPYKMSDFSPLSTINWDAVDVYGAIADMGVPLFVMLTGVLLLDPIKVDEPVKVFFKKRFAKIGLPWIFWTIVYLVWEYYEHGGISTVNLESYLLNGYVHLGFLYLLFGLYLATPVLRILIKHIDHQRFKYLLILWAVGSFTTPFVHIFIGISYNPLLFVFIDWVGYYLLGVYLLQSKVSKRLMYTGLVAGLTGAIVGDALIPIFAGANTMGFFHEYIIVTIIAASAGLFLILASIPKTRFESNTLGNRLLHWIGQNTLPIYLIHLIVLQLISSYLNTLQNSLIQIPIIQQPLLTILTFAVSIAVIYPLKKIPYVSKIIG